MADRRSHYEVLGVRPGAPRDEIRQAHRRLARVLHPDRHTQASEAERRLAERRMREINQAWHVLSDERRRAEYDRGLDRAAAGANSGNGNGSGSGATAHGTAGTARARGAGPTDRRAGAPGSRPTSGGAPSASSGAGPSRPAHSGRPVGARRHREPEVSAPVSFLARRGPLVVVLLVALGLLLVTAYAGSDAGRGPVREVSGTRECVMVLNGSSGQYVDCSLPNDGRVVAEVDAPLDCPEDTRYVLVDADFVCIPVAAG